MTRNAMIFNGTNRDHAAAVVIVSEQTFFTLFLRMRILVTWRVISR